MAIIIAKQIYIGYQDRRHVHGSEETSTGEPLLGFATYLEDNKAFEKRKSTIDSWASNVYGQWNPETRQRENIDTIPADIISNDLLEGFKMAREVRRYGWGSGNVLWRIEDPRGFELEISSANMASIMSCTTMINGVIQGKCKWGWNTVGGSKVVLLPEDSEPYQEATEDTTRRNAKPIALKDLKPGYQVELKNGTVGMYYGTYHYVAADHASEEHFQHGYVWKPSKRKSSFFLLPDGRLYKMTSPKVTCVLSTVNSMTEEEAVAALNTQFRIETTVDSAGGSGMEVVFVAPKMIKPEEYEAVLMPIEYEDFDNIINQYGRSTPNLCWRRYPVLADFGGELHRIESSGYMSKTDHVLVQIDRTELLDNCFYLRHVAARSLGNTMFGRHTGYQELIKRDVSKDALKHHKLSIFVLKYNNKLYSPRIY